MSPKPAETTTEPFGEHLVRVSADNSNKGSVCCLALSHNERHLFEDFFAHYRAFGDIHFIIVDDHSTDGSLDWLLAQNDVTVFQPAKGSTYSAHKRVWRQELLDHFSTDHWCLVPDMDERLMWEGFEDRPFAEFLQTQQDSGAEAVFCTMIDMYKDAPIGEHVYDGTGSLLDNFPYFDSAILDPLSYRMFLMPSRFAKNWKTPRMGVFGGMRDRLFFSHNRDRSTFVRTLFAKLQTFRTPMPTGLRYTIENILRRFLKSPNADMPELNMTKLGLLRWKQGTQFNGGPHATSKPYAVADESAVFLHFAITKGIAGMEYIGKRGQHAAQGGYYTKAKNHPDILSLHPRYFATQKLNHSSDLAPFLGKTKRGLFK